MTMYRSNRQGDCSPMQALVFVVFWIGLSIMIWTSGAHLMAAALMPVLGQFIAVTLTIFLVGLASLIILVLGLLGLAVITELFS